MSQAKIREADMKRQRGRNRRSGGGGNNPNRHFESNGPDVKIRGSAQQVLDKYLQYARDAQTSGDRVMSEAYFQHAEHYQRLLAAMQPKEKPKRDRDDQGDEASEEAEAKSDGDTGDETSEDKKEKSESGSRGRSRSRRGRDKDEADESASEETGSADPLKVIDGEEASEDAPKPRKRRTYKKRETAENETAASDSDGVMKTLARGQGAKDEATGPAASDESSAAPAAE